jgi:hypothetical protein
MSKKLASETCCHPAASRYEAFQIASQIASESGTSSTSR